MSVLGDNPGRYFIVVGGFVESCSGPGHSCYFCVVTHEDLAKGHHDAACLETRPEQLSDTTMRYDS